MKVEKASRRVQRDKTLRERAETKSTCKYMLSSTSDGLITVWRPNYAFVWQMRSRPPVNRTKMTVFKADSIMIVYS